VNIIEVNPERDIALLREDGSYLQFLRDADTGDCWMVLSGESALKFADVADARFYLNSALDLYEEDSK